MSASSNAVVDFIYRTLTPRIAPMVYIMMGVSVFIGFCFMTNTLVAESESILYDTGVLVDKQIWGGILFGTATCAELGFFLKHKGLILLGGIAGFMAWLFASISLVMEDHWYILISVAMFHLLFHGYVYLAGSLDLLEREPVKRP